RVPRKSSSGSSPISTCRPSGTSPRRRSLARWRVGGLAPAHPPRRPALHPFYGVRRWISGAEASLSVDQVVNGRDVMKRLTIVIAFVARGLAPAAAGLADPGGNGKKGKAGHAKFTFAMTTTDNGS